MDKCKDLVPDYFRFVKGLVDSNDLSLNISREILQQNSVLKKIASNIEKKRASKLESMLKNDREEYEKIFKNFGTQLKFGCYNDFGMNKDNLKDLIFPISLINSLSKSTFSKVVLSNTIVGK